MSSSYSFSSSTTSSTSTSTNGQTHTHSQSTESHYNDRDGGFSERTTSETGRPTIVETATVPATGARGLDSAGGDGERRIEDVTDREGDSQSEADKRYLEAMEEEYAKREGGA